MNGLFDARAFERQPLEGAVIESGRIVASPACQAAASPIAMSAASAPAFIAPLKPPDWPNEDAR